MPAPVTTIRKDVLHERRSHTAELHRFTLSSVALSDDSGVVALDIGTWHGVLNQLAISSANNVVYDLHLYDQSSGGDGTVDEVLALTGISQHDQRTSLARGFANNDDPTMLAPSNFLYVKIVNTSGSTATGLITL